MMCTTAVQNQILDEEAQEGFHKGDKNAQSHWKIRLVLVPQIQSQTPTRALEEEHGEKIKTFI